MYVFQPSYAWWELTEPQMFIERGKDTAVYRWLSLYLKI